MLLHKSAVLALLWVRASTNLAFVFAGVSSCKAQQACDTPAAAVLPIW
jgi:hypothetical protein